MIFFSYFSSKPYVVIPHLNISSRRGGSDEGSQHMFLCRIYEPPHLVESVQMRGHTIYFHAELKIIPN